MCVSATMILKSFSISSALAVLALCPGVASANKPSVTIAAQTFVERISTDTNGRQRRILAQPQELGRGDRLVFVVRYRNDGVAPVSGFAFTNPIPAVLRVDPSNPDMQVSVDRGRHWGRLDTLTVSTPFGGIRRATPDDVTHVRWRLPDRIAPGGEGRISYRATVK